MLNSGEVCKHGMRIESCTTCRKTVYPDSIRFTTDELDKATRFAREAPMHDLQPVSSRMPNSDRDVRNRRIHKLGQIAFVKFLVKYGKTHSAMKGVFTRWTDFETADGKRIYVNATGTDSYRSIFVRPGKVRDHRTAYYLCIHIVEAESIAIMKGFATTDEMEESGIFASAWGDRAYVRSWAHLHPISQLLRKSSIFYLKPKVLFEVDDLFE